MPVLGASVSKISSRRKEDYSRSTLVSIPASFRELKPNVSNRLVVQQSPTQEPVSAVEAREVRSDVSYLTTVIEICEVSVVPYCRRLSRELKIISQDNSGEALWS